MGCIHSFFFLPQLPHVSNGENNPEEFCVIKCVNTMLARLGEGPGTE